MVRKFLKEFPRGGHKSDALARSTLQNAKKEAWNRWIFKKYIDDPARFASDWRVRSPARSAKVFFFFFTPHSAKRCGFLVVVEGFEPLTSRMRSVFFFILTLKKLPKEKTFLWENGKKYRCNAGFQTSITFEKKLPFLLQCKKVTLQEGCASDAIWTGDHLNTSCGSRTVWGWFGLYPLCNKINEKQLDFFWLFLFLCVNRRKQCRSLRTQQRWKYTKRLSNIVLLCTKYSNRYTHHETYTV